MEWAVEFTGEFERWWNTLSESEREDVSSKVILLQKFGPALRRPHSGAIRSSRHPNRKELIASIKAGRTVFSTLLTRAAARFC